MAGAMAAGVGLQIGGQIYSTIEAIKAAKAARRETRRIQRQTWNDMLIETQLRRQEGARLEGVQQQRIAASGVRVGTGSPLDVLAETHLATEFAARRIEETAQRLIYRVGREFRAMKAGLRSSTISNVLSSSAGTLMSLGTSMGSGNMTVPTGTQTLPTVPATSGWGSFNA